MAAFSAKTLRNTLLALAAAVWTGHSAESGREYNFGRHLSQEIGLAAPLSGDGPVRNEYRLRAQVSEPFFSLDSVSRSHWLKDWIKIYGDVAVSTFYISGEMGMAVRPFGPFEFGGSYEATFFPYSTASFSIDSLGKTWREKELSRRLDHVNDPGYIQIAAGWFGLRERFGRTVAELRLGAMAVDVSEDSQTGVYHFGYELPLKRGNKITEWIFHMEHALGRGSWDRSLTIGSLTRILGLNSHWEPFPNPFPGAKGIAHVKSALWLGIPLPWNLRLDAGPVYSNHSQGGGRSFFDDRVGAMAKLRWNWSLNDFSRSAP